MRRPDRLARRAQARALAGVAAIAWLVAACGGAAPSAAILATPRPTPTPSPTPRPHLTEPATADAVYLALLEDDLRVVSNTAVAGGAGKDPIKRIEATYLGWPLSISEYGSATSLAKDRGWKSGAKPVRDDRPITFMGLNIIVEFGPSTVLGPEQPDDAQLAGAVALRASLEGLLSPLKARTIVAVPGPSPIPGPSARPGASTEVTATP
jgi:hypothetical protein